MIRVGRFSILFYGTLGFPLPVEMQKLFLFLTSDSVWLGGCVNINQATAC